MVIFFQSEMASLQLLFHMSFRDSKLDHRWYYLASTNTPSPSLMSLDSLYSVGCSPQTKITRDSHFIVNDPQGISFPSHIKIVSHRLD